MASSPFDMSGRTGIAPHPVIDELRGLIDRGDFAEVLRRSSHLARQVRRSDDQEGLADALGRLANAGPVAALVAIESLVEVAHHHADDRLVDLLTDPEHVVRRHAAWRLGDREPNERALPPLLELLVAGGISTMHAHRTLRRWAAASRPLVTRAAIAKLSTEESPAARARIVDLLGVIGEDTDQILLHLALDACEAPAVRAAAIGALGERSNPTIGAELRELAAFDDTVATEASLALSTRLHPQRQEREDRDGLRIAQLVLMGGLDGQLSLGGRGDTGGVASLLVSLGAALARHDDVDHVVTIGRGTLTDAVIGSLPASRSRSSFEILAFGDESRPAGSADEAWEHLPAIERSLRRALRSAWPVDMLHLRMADAGALAGAEVAAELDVPICFSVAPDPHNVIESLQARGELDLESFIRLEAQTHVWYRARLIERIARDADRLALFPRSKPIEFLQRADGHGDGQRRSVVAEGIDIGLLERGRCDALDRTSPAVGIDVLDDLAASIPPSRRGLALIISVGRLHPVKGMDRVVSAWAGDSKLHETCNLVIVGGDLEAPSATEASVLDAIDRAVQPTCPRREGLVLLGGRPRRHRNAPDLHCDRTRGLLDRRRRLR